MAIASILYMTQLARKKLNNFQERAKQFSTAILIIHGIGGKFRSKLGTKRVIYQKLANFKWLESVIFGT